MTSTTKAPAVDLRLAVWFTDSPYASGGDRYAHIVVQPVIMARGKYGRQEFTAWNVDSYEIDDVPPAVRALKGLRVQAQIDNRNQEPYGYRVHFQAEHDQMDLREAERILPVLRRLDKKMTALSDRFGYPQDLVMFLAHLADALGLAGKPFVHRVGDDSDYEGHGHRSMDVSALRYWLESEVQQWRDKYGIPAPAAE